MSFEKESVLPVPVTAQDAKQPIFKDRHTASVSLKKAAMGGRAYSTHQPFSNDKSPPNTDILEKNGEMASHTPEL
jgi:hypothetical protein